MKFTLEIDCKGAAFSENPGIELSAILHSVANTVHDVYNNSPIKQSVFDINGNQCGTWALESSK